MGRERTERRASAIALLVILLALPSAAQEAPTEAMEPPSQIPPPPLIRVSEFSLAEAVRLTLLYNPQIQTAKQEVAFAAGALQEERGFFDHALEAAPAYTHSKSEILPFLRKPS